MDILKLKNTITKFTKKSMEGLSQIKITEERIDL